MTKPALLLWDESAEHLLDDALSDRFEFIRLWEAGDPDAVIGSRGGEVVRPFDLALTWKIKAAETGFAFSVYEMTMAPGAEIPIHVHPFAEFFYVLEGQVDVGAHTPERRARG